jgi:serine/threonine protein kinase
MKSSANAGSEENEESLSKDESQKLPRQGTRDSLSGEKLNSFTAQDSSQCPELTLLIELVQETLAEDWVEATSHHLERCQHCQMKIDRWLDGTEGEKADGGLIPGYELGIELGRGGMGVVYQATRQTTGEVVALKVLSPHFLENSDFIKRFQQEVETLNRLDHPGIVRIVDSGVLRRQPWFAMELIQGPTLQDFLGARPQPPLSTTSFMLQILPALEVAHQNGIVHRDLKLNNILLQPLRPNHVGREKDLAAYLPKIVDFGVAKWLGNTTELTQTGEFIGSLEYMSPEVLLGESKGDPRSDIYAVGVLLYVLLVGRTPFQALTIADLVRRIATEPPVSPRQFDSGIPLPLERICLKCLHRYPKDRYSTVQEVREDLERFSRGEQVHARPLALSRRLQMWGQRNPIPLIAIVMGLLSIVLVFSLMIRHQLQLSREKEQTEASLRIAVSTAELTFDRFYKILGELKQDNMEFRSGGIIDAMLEKLLLIEEQRPNDISLQLLLARLETSRAEEEKNLSLREQDASQSIAHLQRAQALIDRSIGRTAKIRNGEYQIAALKQHEYGCRLASEIDRYQNKIDSARQLLREGQEAIETLRSAEPREGKHICRYLMLLTERSWLIWDDWTSQRSSDVLTMEALVQYVKNVEQAAKQLREIERDQDMEAVRALRCAYGDLAEWYFELGKLKDPKHFETALAFNELATKLAEREYAFLPTADSANTAEKLRANFRRIEKFAEIPAAGWRDQRNSFYQEIQKLAPREMAGDRYLHLHKAVQYELDVVEKNLSSDYFLKLEQWQQLRRLLEETYLSLNKDTASSIANEYENLRLRVEKRIGAGP